MWQYIAAEELELPSIYLAHEREVFARDGMLYAVSDFIELMRRRGAVHESVRYRTVGDMSCTGAVRSTRDARCPRWWPRSRRRHHRARRDARRRPRVRGRDGRPQARGLLLDVDLLRLATAGSVDDGKSTLIGRLLYDSKAVLADQLAQRRGVARAQRRRALDLALLTDGLRAEREQGITIDVAYRYFATPRRRFILADCPGHAQYTRNMVTGASTADLALLLVDARAGLTEQSRRHAAIAALLRVGHVIVAVNKMDLVDCSEEVFDAHRAPTFDCFASKIGLGAVTTFIPISALHGDNVVEPSERLRLVRRAAAARAPRDVECPSSAPAARRRLPVQSCCAARTAPRLRRPLGGRRAAAGRRGRRAARAAARTRSPRSRRRRDRSRPPLAPLSVSVRLEDELDLARGDVLAAAEDSARGDPFVRARTSAGSPSGRLRPGARLAAEAWDTRPCGRSSTRWSTGSTWRRRASAARDGLALNDIGRVRLRVSSPLPAEPYAANRVTGAFILVDEGTHETVGAGMVGLAEPDHEVGAAAGRRPRSRRCAGRSA